jgi:hypothetical protein
LLISFTPRSAFPSNRCATRRCSVIRSSSAIALLASAGLVATVDPVTSAHPVSYDRKH